MKRTPLSRDRIAEALKQEELGMPVADVIRQAGITERTFQQWKKLYGSLSDEPQHLTCLQEENAQLKQIVVELTLQNSRLEDVWKKKHYIH
ncbi:transposase [Glaciimonas immobilis]|uniref:Putative transposase n=1 Tax=Glaciimonas immobilis TaxID=728004 RepID=A0A840RRT1_9BURK|nr:transposase [Glaciimonas immobilis]KAF3999981.1 transposase [Glaciimonas immobilis]MBB5200485.1 putative transposase [Glaciimonas immobilis]